MARTRYKILKGDYFPYFLTATTVNWLPLFSNPAIAQIAFDSLSFLQRENRLTIYAYVLMENHLHLIASAESLSKEIANFKSFTARQSIDYYAEQGNQFILKQLALHKLPHKADREYQFWQEGSHPKRIQSEATLRQKVDYIHFNPVRRGYVKEPEHWRYSSARNYAGLDAVLDICTEW
jgi:REP element-mobilizing transposase RayT